MAIIDCSSPLIEVDRHFSPQH